MPRHSRIHSLSARLLSSLKHRRLAILFFIAILGGCAEHIQIDSSAKQTSFQGNHPIRYDLPADGVIVKFAKDAAGESTQAKGLRSRVLKELGVKDSTDMDVLLSGLVVANVSQETIQYTVQTLLLNPLVEYAEPNYLVSRAAVPNDTDFNQQWALNNTGQTGGKIGADIKAPAAWDLQTGNDVVVAVIDTGVDYNHPDLVDNMWVNSREIPDNGIDDDQNGYVDDVRGWNFVDNNNDPMDLNNHGTHVAGIIAAKGNNNLGVSGVSWNARIMPLRFMDASGTGSTATAIRAIQYAVANGARISNNSWGGSGYSQALYDVINAAAKAQHIVVTAAGNSGSDNDVVPQYPSGFDLSNILSVAASDDNDNLAYFSNFGAQTVDIAAPGSRILSTVRAGRYATLSGSSMAAPLVSGVASLVLAQTPALSSSEVINRIIATADPVAMMNGRLASGGRLNAFKALSPDNLVTPPTQTTPVVISVSPNNAVLRVGESKQFVATGGSGNYRWRLVSPVNASLFAEVSTSGMLLAKSAGNIQFVVDDLANQVSSQIISVQINAIEIQPSNLSQLSVGQQINLNVVGGSGSFTWNIVDAISGQALSGVATVIATTDTRSATLTVTGAGNFVVEVVDTATMEVSNSATIQANAVAVQLDPVSIATPASTVLNIGDTLQLVASGGVAPYQWQSSDGQRVSVGLNDGILQAKTYSLPGQPITISVIDAQGNGDSLAVSVNPAPLAITASRTALTVGDTYQISVSGGIAPYGWTSANAAIISVAKNASDSSQASVNAVYTSAGLSISITVQDSVGTTTSLGFTATPAPLMISNDGPVIWVGNNGNTVLMTAEGGVAPYTWQEIVGSTRLLNVGSQTGQMTAREYAGVANIRVTDSAGTFVNGTVEIRKVAITGLPSSVSLTSNSSGTVIASATTGVEVIGVKPLNSVTVVDSSTGNATSAATMSLNEDGTYTFTAKVAGSVKVRVSDANGNQASSGTISITETTSCSEHRC